MDKFLTTGKEYYFDLSVLMVVIGKVQGLATFYPGDSCIKGV
jgi:hypothetical protein